MNFALTYLTWRLFYRIADFFHHWYVDASRSFFHRLISLWEKLDETIAIRITIKYFFQPLYKDYSVVGRILGIIFRSARILIGLFVYAFTSVCFLALYILWILTPPAVLFYAFQHVV